MPPVAGTANSCDSSRSPSTVVDALTACPDASRGTRRGPLVGPGGHRRRAAGQLDRLIGNDVGHRAADDAHGDGAGRRDRRPAAERPTSASGRASARRRASARARAHGRAPGQHDCDNATAANRRCPQRHRPSRVPQRLQNAASMIVRGAAGGADTARVGSFGDRSASGRSRTGSASAPPAAPRLERRAAPVEPRASHSSPAARSARARSAHGSRRRLRRACFISIIARAAAGPPSRRSPSATPCPSRDRTRAP